jgi:hypothetical protein
MDRYFKLSIRFLMFAERAVLDIITQELTTSTGALFRIAPRLFSCQYHKWRYCGIALRVPSVMDRER